MKAPSAGFTLIELMIVVAIIGILAAIAIPQFAGMVAKSQEAKTKGNLGTLRSAISIYYADMEGFYPAPVTDTLGLVLTVNERYLKSVPEAVFPTTSFSVGHPKSNYVWTYAVGAPPLGSTGADVRNGPAIMEAINQPGGWVYSATPGNATWGMIVPNCSHTDEKGTSWAWIQ